MLLQLQVVLSPVNPPLKFYKDSTVEFDLSDSSLSYTQSSKNILRLTSNYTKIINLQEYETSGSLDTFDVTRTGTVGVSADAKLTLKVNEEYSNLIIL